ncbi:hypothetical protein [Polaribacter sp.]|uniref:hypothetical protein n=1 Tax=Polaribacter sp. TaxID=1920175 RepID=UPI003F6ACC36
MNSNTFIDLLENKKEIQQVETAELKAIVEKYPYFQNARALYLKGLKNQDSFKYNNELKITAAYTTDRSILFDYITKFKTDISKNDIHEEISKKIALEKPSDETNTQPKVDIIAKKEEKEDIQEAKKDLTIGKPISFSANESHSFHQWLQLSTKKTIVRKPEEKSVKKPEKTLEIIDKFIETNPKIEPLEKGKTIAVPITENKQNDALMTETLAKVYLEQKKYENAIQAYRILSLKYPEKSGFFADQIKRIQILQKNKS